MDVETSDGSETSEPWHSNTGYTRFCEALNDNRIKAGATLTQSQLSKILDMSLSPLRETLVLLEDYGLVEIKQRAGVRIFFPDVSFIRENMQFRSMVELFALPVFMRKVSEQWLAEVREQHDDLLKKWRASRNDRNDTLEAASQVLDRQLHNAIVNSLGNKSIRDSHNRTWENVRIARKVHQTSFGKAHYIETISEHLKVLDAVQASDIEAATKALEEHFTAATHRLFVAP